MEHFFNCNLCNYNLCKECTSDRFGVLALKLSPTADHLIAVAFNIRNFRNDLIVYDTIQKKENGRNLLISGGFKHFSLKNYFDFLSESIIVRSDNKKSFKQISLKKVEIISLGP